MNTIQSWLLLISALLECGYYSRAAFIIFGLIPCGVIDNNSSTKACLLRTILQVFKILLKGKLSHYLRTKPSLSSATSLPRKNDCARLAIVATHLIVLAHACGYYCFQRAPGVATIQGVASIRTNTVTINYELQVSPTCTFAVNRFTNVNLCIIFYDTV